MEDSFRDHLATVDEQGRRKWIYPKKPSGRYYNARTILSWFLLIFLFTAPFIHMDGNQLLMFNILERKFIIFGFLFYPHDFYIFMFAMITAVIGIAIFTLVFGRLFCGWVCPQTIFMEMLFRKIEYLIEGDWNEQRKLDAAPMTGKKFFKKALKHTIFLALSFFIANIFLAYIIGSKALLEIITDPPAEHIVGLVIISIFSVVFYLVFSHLREQVCTTVCPYGRLQSVLLDKYSIVIAYDHVRGEDRAKFKPSENRAEKGFGDCVDCKQCVHVCPTGIDIRNGTQLECTNCTACIDACDGVMDKLGMEKGLIRYTSEHKINNPEDKTWFTSRNWLFIGLMLVLLGVLGILFSLRVSVELTLLRTPGQLFQEPSPGKVSNLYNYSIYNKTNEDMVLHFKFERAVEGGKIQVIGSDSLHIAKQGNLSGSLFVIIDKAQVQGRDTDLYIGLYHGEERLDVKKTNFVGPH
jgi:cytochrome c oxidase accessory protein FixG